MIRDGELESNNGDIWVIRAGQKGIYAQRFLDYGRASIGWDVGPLTDATDDEDIKILFSETYAYEKPGTQLSWASQTIRFFKEVAIGDTVTTYSADERLYHIGIIDSVSRQTVRIIDDEGRNEYARDVKWLYKVPRDDLSLGTRNSLGSSLTVFRLPANASQELRERCTTTNGVTAGGSADAPLAESESEQILKDYLANAEDLVEDRIDKLGWEDLQHLVAGILRAMGYRTRVASPGPDRGVDVFASPDGLGLSEPRIFVEVKHRVGTIGADQIRSFMGGRQPGDRCLYVSTGGFSQQARYEADRSSIPLTLMNRADLREWLLVHYESLDTVTRAFIPLRRIYIPVEE